jgi:hypothetical protein
MRALFISAALMLVACDSPSQQPKTMDSINQIVSIADKALAMARMTAADTPTADVDAAMQELHIALRAAASEIDDVTQRISAGKYLGRGSIDPRDVSVCVAANIAGLGLLENEVSRALGLSNAIDCAITAKTYFHSISEGDGAAVALGIGVIYPLALAAHVKTGVTLEPWLQEYRSANDAIVAKLAQRCRERKDPAPGGSEQVPYKCAAYEVAMSVQPKLAALAARAATPR